jgi:glucose dehydrogenase
VIRTRWALLGASLLAACATSEKMGDRVNPEVPSWYARPSGDMNVLAHRKLTSESRKTGEDYERGRPEIDPWRGRVFVGSSDHGLYALRATDLSAIWRYETLGMVQSEPTYDRDLDQVYFGSNDGRLYAVRAADGGLVWAFDSGAEIARKAVVEGETLVVANASDQLFALDRRSGKQLWKVVRQPAAGMELAGYAGPTVDHDKVYFATSDGHVSAFDLRDGKERWSPVDLAAEAEQQAGSTPQP